MSSFNQIGAAGQQPRYMAKEVIPGHMHTVGNA
jgi:hypothetical protein